MGLGYRLRMTLARAGLSTRMLFRDSATRNGFELRWGRDRDGTLRGSVVTVEDEGQEYLFFVANDSDTMQREPLSGRLYERDELRLFQRHFPGGTFVDVGTNIGNHAIFAAKGLRAERVVCFEPNPEALRLLRLNLRLNGCGDKVVVHPAGLSDRPGRGLLSGYRNNLGSARFRLTDGADGFPILVGDDVLADERPAFIKIDTEGFELQVLRGLERTIHRCRPVLFVEVDNRNLPGFTALVEKWGYRVESSVRPYADNQNMLLLPNDAEGALPV